MRQKADKLEKGKWYADMENPCTFIKYSYTDGNVQYFEDQIEIWGGTYLTLNGSIPLICQERFIPTQQDREKYNLVDDE